MSAKKLTRTHEQRADRGSEPAPPADLTGKRLWMWHWNRSEKGKASRRRYRQSLKGRETIRRQNASPSQRAAGIRYNRSPHGRIMRLLFSQRPAQKLRFKLNLQRRPNG